MHAHAVHIQMHTKCTSLATRKVLSIIPKIHRGNVRISFCLRESILISFSSDAHMTAHNTSFTFLSLYPGNMLEKKDLHFN